MIGVDVGRPLSEKYYAKGRAEEKKVSARQHIKALMENGMSFEQATKMLKITKQDIEKYQLSDLKDMH